MKVLLVTALMLAAMARPAAAAELPPGQPGGLTLQGAHTDATPEVEPSLPLALTAPVALAIDAAGLALVIPELSFRHVLGFQYDARRARGYLGLGLMSLEPPVALLLSGAGASTAAICGVVEAGAIGVSFGFAYLADLSFHSGPWVAPNGIFPLIVAAVGAVVALAFPVAAAFTNGAQLEAHGEPQRGPTFGLVPLERGGAVVLAGRF